MSWLTIRLPRIVVVRISRRRFGYAALHLEHVYVRLQHQEPNASRHELRAAIIKFCRGVIEGDPDEKPVQHVQNELRSWERQRERGVKREKR